MGSMVRLAARAVFLGLGLILACTAGSTAASAAAAVDPSPTAAAQWGTDGGGAPTAAGGEPWSAETPAASSVTPADEAAPAGETESRAEDTWTVDGTGAVGEDGAAVTEQQAPRAADEGRAGAPSDAVAGKGAAPSDGTDPMSVAAPRVEDPTPAGASEQSATFELAETDGSGVSGTATLSATDGGTTIVLAVGGAGAAAFGGLVFGACGSLAIDSLIPLGPLDASGALETQVPGIPLDRLRGRYAVIAYVLAGEGYAVLACGDVPASTGGTAGASTEAGDGASPAGGTGGITTTGVGTAAVPAHGGVPLAVILLAASLLAAGGAATRRLWVR